MSEHRSVWQGSAQWVSFPRLGQDVEADVAVIGAGITGVTAATLLQRGGKKVVLIEAAEVGAGTTGNTSGHLTTMPDRRYSTLLQTFGEEAATGVRRSMQAALDLVESLATGGDQFFRLPGYLYTESAEDTASLEAELEAAQRVGLEATLVRDVPLPFATRGGVRIENQAQFQPLAYIRRLAQALLKDGSQVFEHSPVLGLTDGEPCEVRTMDGTVRAKDVVLATHLPLGVNVLQTEAAPYRSYVMGVMLRKEPPEGLFWDTAEPYHYTRTYTHNGESVLIVGGADHKTGEADTQAHFERLEAYVSEHFEVQAVRYRWSSQLYEPADGLPYIGLSPFAEHIHVGTGYSGDGLTFGSLAGLMLARDLLGEPNPWHDLLSPRRLTPTASAKDWLSENLDVARHLADDHLQGDEEDFGEVGSGEGKVVTKGAQKLAVYRSEDGTLNVRSAVCPHLGCVVHWNGAETSWDCPCHGSRFAPTGEVLVGPALSGLESH